jgi:hypothetical protein
MLDESIKQLLSVSKKIAELTGATNKTHEWVARVISFEKSYLKAGDPEKVRPIFQRFYNEFTAQFEDYAVTRDEGGTINLNDWLVEEQNLEAADPGIPKASASAAASVPKAKGKSSGTVIATKPLAPCLGYVIYLDKKLKSVSIPVSQIYMAARQIQPATGQYPCRVLVLLYTIMSEFGFARDDSMANNVMYLTDVYNTIVSENDIPDEVEPKGKGVDGLTSMMKTAASKFNLGEKTDWNGMFEKGKKVVSDFAKKAQNKSKPLEIFDAIKETIEDNNLEEVINQVTDNVRGAVADPDAQKMIKRMKDGAGELFNKPGVPEIEAPRE